MRGVIRVVHRHLHGSRADVEHEGEGHGRVLLGVEVHLEAPTEEHQVHRGRQQNAEAVLALVQRHVVEVGPDRPVGSEVPHGAGASYSPDFGDRGHVARGNGYAAAQIDRDFASRRLCHPRAGNGEHGQDCEKHTVLRGVMQRFLLRWRAENSRLPDHDERLIDAYFRRFRRDQNRDRTTASCAGTLPRPSGTRQLLIRRPGRPHPPPAWRGSQPAARGPAPTR